MSPEFRRGWEQAIQTLRHELSNVDGVFVEYAHAPDEVVLRAPYGGVSDEAIYAAYARAVATTRAASLPPLPTIMRTG